MYLYHYSKKKFDTLQTLEKQRLSAKDRSTDKDYGKHISFFIERPPLAKLGDIFGEGHHTWYPGNALHEYIVSVDSLRKFRYQVVEFPEKTAVYYDDKMTDAEYYKILAEASKEWRYASDNVEDLRFAMRHLQGTTEKYYGLIHTRPNKERLFQTYAGTVPHVMVYPDSGEIRYKSVSQVTVGGKKTRNSFKDW